MSAIRELHVVAHTHWDREWYHTAGAFQQRLVRLIDELLDAPPLGDDSFLLDGQAVVLEDYLAVRPDRAGELSQLLRSGQLEAGPWYVLADNLIPSGEALVRNLLQGRHIVRRLRGEPPPVVYCPDSFGHPAILPDLATGFGYDLIVLWRGLGGRRAPSADVMHWTGAAGASTVVYHLPPDGYEFGSNLPVEPARARQRWIRLQAVLAPRSNTGVTILLNGADHHARQNDDVAAITQLVEAAAPVRVRRSSLAVAARAVLRCTDDTSLPELAGELRDSYGYTWTLQGTFGTRASQKRQNAIAERRLVRDVEPWIALSDQGGDGAARALLDHTWRTLLQAHPHDTLCGTSVDAVALAFDARVAAVAVESRALRDSAMASLLRHDAERARESGDWRSAMIVRNSVARPRAGVVEINLRSTIAAIAVGPGSADRQGAQLPQRAWAVSGVSLQVLDEHERVELTESPRAYPKADRILEARAVGWMDTMGGYEVRTLEHVVSESVNVEHPVTVTDATLDNGLVRVEVSDDGRIAFIDVEGNRRLDGVLALERRRDVGDLYTPALRDEMPIGPSRRTGVVHTGPLRGSIGVEMDGVEGEGGPGVITVDVELDANARFVRFRIRGDNRLSDQRTRLCINTGLIASGTLADAAFHPVTRAPIVVHPDDEAMEHVVPTAPLHRWVARLGDDGTAAIASDGLAEYESMAHGAICVTLVRSVGELSRCDLPERPGHAGWPAPTPNAQCHGDYEACLALQLFGADSPDVRDAIEQFAEDVLLPLRGETLRSNLLPAQRVGGLELGGAGLVFSAALPARIPGWIVLRCVNRRSTAVQGQWTLRVPVYDAVVARLDETPVEQAPLARGSITFLAPARAIVTVLARVAADPASRA
ncbi:MAG: hypothetical protein M3Z05_00150 [Gemmatimonadota bacterium]|nr:hypothetical protein [Gemmatimonadota bacterium]